jgi:hypothetical protein
MDTDFAGASLLGITVISDRFTLRVEVFSSTPPAEPWGLAHTSATTDKPTAIPSGTPPIIPSMTPPCKRAPDGPQLSKVSGVGDGNERLSEYGSCLVRGGLLDRL